MKDMVLVKDIVIPAGTVVREAPKKVEYYSLHGEALVAFGPDCTGSLFLDIEDMPEGYLKELQ